MTHPANWYPDPSDPLQWRWFDGTAWTEHVAPTTTPQAQQPQATAMPSGPANSPLLSSGHQEKLTTGQMKVSPKTGAILVHPGANHRVFTWFLRLLLLSWLALLIFTTVSPTAGSATASPALPIIVLSLLSGLLAAGFCLYLSSQTRETKPGFPVLFEPPIGVFPALGARILHGKDSPEALQATLFDLAQRGLLQLTGDYGTWTVTVIADPAATHLWPGETEMLSALDLTAVGDSFKVSKSILSGWQILIGEAALRSGVLTAAKSYLTPSRPGTASVVLGWLAICPTFYLVLPPASNMGLLLWPLMSASVVFVYMNAGMMFRPGILTKRSAAGRDVWARTGGFARFLAMTSSESRFETAEHSDRFLTYLPWATALGSVEAWSQRYETPGSPTPVLPWITWSGTGHSYSMNEMVTSFNLAVGEAAAYYSQNTP